MGRVQEQKLRKCGIVPRGSLLSGILSLPFGGANLSFADGLSGIGVVVDLLEEDGFLE